jgi:hypothetical protein
MHLSFNVFVDLISRWHKSFISLCFKYLTCFESSSIFWICIFSYSLYSYREQRQPYIFFIWFLMTFGLYLNHSLGLVWTELDTDLTLVCFLSIFLSFWIQAEVSSYHKTILLVTLIGLNSHSCSLSLSSVNDIDSNFSAIFAHSLIFGIRSSVIFLQLNIQCGLLINEPYIIGSNIIILLIFSFSSLI